jgi:tetratricopeptide (TPR) repeat protein
LRLLGAKALKALGPYEYPNNYSFRLERGAVWILWLYPVSFTMLLFPGLLGLLWLPRRNPGAVILPAAAAVGLLTSLLFFVTSRYRLEMIPALALLAGWGVVAGVDRIRRRKLGWRELLVAVLLALISLAPAGAGRGSQESMMWLHLGTIYRDMGRPAEAEKALRSALELQPDNVQARSQLAMVLTREGRLDEAGETLRPALRAAPPHPAALWAAGELRSAGGDTLGALAALREAVRRAPRLEPAVLALARLQIRAGDRQNAIDLLRRTVRSGASSREIDTLLGLLLVGAGRAPEAESVLPRGRAEEILELYLSERFPRGIWEALSNEERFVFRENLPDTVLVGRGSAGAGAP